MATTRDLCTNALRNLGLEGLSSTPDNREIKDALRHLNNIIKQLNVSGILSKKQVLTNVTTNADTIYIGPIPPTTPGITTIVTDNVPSTISSFSIETDNTITPLISISEREYRDYSRITDGSEPRYYIWQPVSTSYGIIEIYPKPSATTTYQIGYLQVIGTLVLDDVLDLQEAVEAYLEYRLTDILGKVYAVDTSAWQALHIQFYEVIRRANIQTTYLSNGDVGGGSSYNVDSDRYI